MKNFAVRIVLMLLCVGTIASGRQAGPASPDIPKSVNAAERDGASHPRGEPPATLGPSFADRSIQGTPERKCVAFPVGVEPLSRRSGEVMVGGSIAALKAGKEGKVWWAPMHDPAAVKNTLIVRGARLDAAERTALFSSKEYAWPLVADGKKHAFFPSGYSLPEAGHWLLTVTSGDDWGCFVVTVR